MIYELSRRLVRTFVVFYFVLVHCVVASLSQVTNPPSTILGDLSEQFYASLTQQLPKHVKVEMLKSHEETVLSLRSQVFQEVGGREKFGNELLEISERYFSLAEFSESDRLNSSIAKDFPDSIIGAVANSRLAYSTETIGKNRADATAYYEKAMRKFRSMDLENDLTAAYAAMSVFNNAADNYMLQGRDTEAEDLFRHILDSNELSKVVLADVRLNAANELASLLRKKGDWEGAAKRFREATSFVANSLQPDEFKDKLLLSLWESEMDSRFRSMLRSGSTTKPHFALDTAGLEEIWLGLRDKKKSLGLRVGSTLLLCYRFGNENAKRVKIPDLAVEVIEIIGERPDPESVDYHYLVQARLLRVEELKRSDAPGYQKELDLFLEERKRAEDREFMPMVSARFPDHKNVEQKLKKVDAELAQPKLAEPASEKTGN